VMREKHLLEHSIRYMGDVNVVPRVAETILSNRINIFYHFA
jgi:hypothetical protein